MPVSILHNYPRKTAFERRGKQNPSLRLWAVLTMGIGLALPLPVQAQQAGGNEIIARMLKTYHVLQTIQETAEAKLNITGQGRLVQVTRLAYKRPNLFSISSTDPSLGTLEIRSDGGVLTVFSGKYNLFTRRNAPLNLKQDLRQIPKATSLIAAGTETTQILSTLSLLAAKDRLDEAKSFRLMGHERVEGMDCIKLAGLADNAWLHTLVKVPSVVLDKREITLWVNARTYLLVKARCRFSWYIVQGKTKAGKLVAIAGGVEFEEMHRKTLINTPLRDEDFQFFPPKGAEEKFQEKRD